MKMKALATLAVLILVGCRSANTGSFRFVDPARLEAPIDASKLRIEQGRTIFVDAKAIGHLLDPTFPSGTFRALHLAVTIVVRVAIDEKGKASVVGKSVADVSVRTSFTEACDAAIGRAVAQWRFEPAQLAILEPQEKGQPLLVSSTSTDTTIEIAFTFTPSGHVDLQATRK